MASLTGTKIKDTYDALLKVSDNGALDGTLQTITDGLGNNSALSLSTAGASVGGTLAVTGNLTVDTNTLFVDAANNKIGIGTDTPSGALTINTLDENHIRLENGVELGVVRLLDSGILDIYSHGDVNNEITFTNGSGSGVERMRIHSGGDISFRDSSNNEAFYWDASAARLSLGAGSSPSAKLDIGSNTAGSVQAIFGRGNDDSSFSVRYTNGVAGSSNAVQGTIGLDYANGVWADMAAVKFIRDSVAGELAFYTSAGASSGTERMRINSGGQVLIDTSTNFPFRAQSLQATTAHFRAPDFYGVASVLTLSSVTNTDGGLFIEFMDSSGTRIGSVTKNSASTVAYNTSSDYRLKEDLQPMQGALDRVDLLKPINFAWKGDGKRTDGFLAHELAEVVPEAVTGFKDEVKMQEVKISDEVLDEEGNVITEAVYEEQEVPVYQGIDQSKIVPLLAAGLQEAHTLIKELRAELNALKQA